MVGGRDNERASRALQRAQDAAGIRSAAEFARRIAVRAGGPLDPSTYQRWLKGQTTVPAWALITAAEEAAQTVDDLLKSADGAIVPPSRYEARIANLEAQLNELQRQLTRPAAVGTELQPIGDEETELKPLAAGVIVRGDRVLLTERRFPGFGEQWSWPSGKVEHGETLEEAILRELVEELLLKDAEIVGYLGFIDLPSGYRMSHFQIRIPDNAEPKLNDYEQLTQTRWMTRDEADEAFKSLPPDVARQALVLLDRVLATTHRISRSTHP